LVGHTSVTGAISTKLEQAEIERAERKPTEKLAASDYFLRGMADIYQGTKAASIEALKHFSQATDIDPNFASAYGTRAYCDDWRKANGWVTDRSKKPRKPNGWPARRQGLAPMMLSRSARPVSRSPLWSATSTTASP
jgi:hypothetical protein